MMKRMSALLLSGLMLLGLLAGCNSGGEPDTSASIGYLDETGAGEVDAGIGDPEGEEGGPIEIEIPDTGFVPAEVHTDVTGEFNYWSYTDTSANLVAAFNQMYPNVTVNLDLYSGDEYKTKLLTTMQSGRNIPDIFDLEEGYVYEFFESDVLEDLGARGYGELIGGYYDYLVAGSKATDGTLKGIVFQSSPVGFWYLRDAMEEWLGTGDEEELAQMLNGWDKILDVAKQVQADSNGAVYLWPNIVEMVKVVGYSFTPLVRENEFKVTDEWLGLLDTMREFYESGAVAELGSWSEQWAAAWNSGELLIRVMPSWDFFTDSANEGNIGIIKPFENAYEGATVVSMWSGSENKEAADLFLRFLCSGEWQKYNMAAYDQVPASSAVARELENGFSSERFGGQNLVRTYDEINSGIAGITPDRYTRPVQNLFQRYANEGIQQGLTNEEIIENLKEQIRENYPEIDGV